MALQICQVCSLCATAFQMSSLQIQMGLAAGLGCRPWPAVSCSVQALQSVRPRNQSSPAVKSLSGLRRSELPRQLPSQQASQQSPPDTKDCLASPDPCCLLAVNSVQADWSRSVYGLLNSSCTAQHRWCPSPRRLFCRWSAFESGPSCTQVSASNRRKRPESADRAVSVPISATVGVQSEVWPSKALRTEVMVCLLGLENLGAPRQLCAQGSQ